MSGHKIKNIGDNLSCSALELKHIRIQTALQSQQDVRCEKHI